MITTPANIVNAASADTEAISEFENYTLKYTRELIERMKVRSLSLKGSRKKELLLNVEFLEEYCEKIEDEGIVSVLNEFQQTVRDHIVAGEISLEQVSDWFIEV